MPVIAYAQSLTSTNYTILSSDFISGILSTSTNYSVNDVIGDAQGTTATSTNYTEYGGLIGQISGTGSLSVTLSASSVSLGQLSTETITSGSMTITVTTDAPAGYSIRMSESTGLTNGSHTLADVADGNVSAGAEEYGIRTSGTDGQYNSTDTSITSSLKTIANSSSPVSARATTVSFKAAIETGTASGSYSQTVTFATVANF